jgi:hypothetical protein
MRRTSARAVTSPSAPCLPPRPLPPLLALSPPRPGYTRSGKGRMHHLRMSADRLQSCRVWRRLVSMNSTGGQSMQQHPCSVAGV